MASVEIDRDVCENSQNCEAICPADVFEIRNGVVEVVRPTECTACFLCVENCPSGAIDVDA